MRESILRDKSFAFAVRIVRLAHYLQDKKKEFVLSKQVVRSGTAIGALVRESEFGQSRADFINKISVALKEAHETDYWMCLLRETDLINQEMAQSMQADCKELVAMLVASVKTAKKNDR